MFSFFQTIFTKVISAVASVIIAVGLVSIPVQKPEPPQQVRIITEAKEEPGTEVEQASSTIPNSVSFPVPAPAKTSKATTSLTKPNPQTVTDPQPTTPPPPLSTPQIPVKELKVKADKSEIWASGFHYANFSFEYLVDNKPEKASVSLKSIIPSEPIFAGWQAMISTDKKFTYSTKTLGKHTLKFVTDTGVEDEVTITAKEWPDRKELEIVPIQTSSTVDVTNNGYFGDIPTVLLGSFKVRTNPNIDISLYDCNVTASNPSVTFGSYKITGAIDGGNNNCFVNTGFTSTDGTGLSDKEFKVYLNDLKVSYINNPGITYKIRFYLNDITIRELSTGGSTLRRATSSLSFYLDVFK